MLSLVGKLLIAEGISYYFSLSIMIWKREPGPEPHGDNRAGRRDKAQVKETSSPASVCACVAPGFSIQDWTHALLRYEERKGKRQTENTC